MKQIKGTINAGVCGFASEVVGASEDGQHVTLAITSDCDKVQRLAALVPELDAYSEIGAGFEGELLRLAREQMQGCCSGCVVPAGLFKAMQVTAGLALPRPVSIDFERLPS